MSTYSITVKFEVEAKDYEEAQLLADQIENSVACQTHFQRLFSNLKDSEVICVEESEEDDAI